MAITEIQNYLTLLPVLKTSPEQAVWVSYDPEADVLYVNFRKNGRATDSELGDEDVIVRYDGSVVIGYTVLNASKRAKDAPPTR